MVDGYLNFDTTVNTKGFNKGVKSISGNMKGLTTSVKAAGAALAAVVATKAVQGLINLSTQAINLASDLEEVQNVVDTAFGSMSYKCEEFADTATEQFGMSKLSAKQTASTYMAMAKSMGLSMEVASDMAVEIAGLTGDVASFYNIEQDLAATKLKSIFTGETETLKDLGVVMTETNLKAYALAQGITKPYSAMTQAEKVSLRYGFVMDALADAQGDFAKTSDSWANQTRVLSERWKELLGILGGGLIKLLTPIVQMLNNIMAALINVANAFSATIGKLFGKQTQITANMASTATEAAEAEGKLATSTEEAGYAASNSTASFDKLNVLQQDTGSGAGGGMSGDIMTVDEEDAKGSDTILDKVSERLQRLQPYVDRLRAAWDNLKGAFERFGQSKGVQMVLKFLKELWLIIADRAIAGGISILTGVIDILAGVLDFLGGLLSFVCGILTGDWDMAWEGATQMLLGAKEMLKGIGEIVEGVLIFLIGEEAVTAIKNFILAAWEWFIQTSLYTTGLKTCLEGLLMFLKGVFTGDWNLAWEGVKTIFKGIWNSIVSIVERAINLIIKAINWCISQLNKIYVEVPDWVEDLTGMRGFGFNIPKLSDVKVPRLATGAVIPPNAEFLAMLGDQRSGNNIEAPEALIRQIVREEGGGDVIINANGTLGQLIRLLEFEINKEEKRRGVKLVKGGAY